MLLEKGVLRIDHDRQRVERDRQFDVLDAGRLALVHFLLQDRPRSVGDVGLAAAELLEAAARAGNADRDLDRVLLRLLEFLGDRLGDRVDGARAIDLDDLLRDGRGSCNKGARRRCGDGQRLQEISGIHDGLSPWLVGESLGIDCYNHVTSREGSLRAPHQALTEGLRGPGKRGTPRAPRPFPPAIPWPEHVPDRRSRLPGTAGWPAPLPGSVHVN